jgi:hypothetical protein
MFRNASATRDGPAFEDGAVFGRHADSKPLVSSHLRDRIPDGAHAQQKLNYIS